MVAKKPKKKESTARRKVDIRRPYTFTKKPKEVEDEPCPYCGNKASEVHAVVRRGKIVGYTCEECESTW